jgi:hypothetical protein
MKKRQRASFLPIPLLSMTDCACVSMRVRASVARKRKAAALMMMDGCVN